MIAAVYARKSTDQNIADEEKSVTRQVERARAYAARQGLAVAEEHIYVDDGISGAEFGEKRPGYLALMNALKPRAQFQILMMREQSASAALCVRCPTRWRASAMPACGCSATSPRRRSTGTA